jgi:hypothetical protein
VDRSVEERKGDKGGNSALIKAVKTVTFFHDVECGTPSHNVEHHHIIRHMQFRI